jgi:hypothetical protein
MTPDRLTVASAAHIGPREAARFAQAVVDVIAERGPACVYLGRDGAVAIELRRGPLDESAALTLAGCYDATATASEIRDGILAAALAPGVAT